ncbi:hypothetical protein TI39_contig4250g00004 [Zymoseptoria brevis]|uniref:FAD/NAD(P)-binding domain-containing protein n=1 Tax=Zymoseptoria brevis TaxID=1047168 RepID=A0A0F4G8X4_9PEZI|nr:hypothetical protein TI39_contig4250g00004 [Zymoseptoria brevis]
MALKPTIIPMSPVSPLSSTFAKSPVSPISTNYAPYMAAPNPSARNRYSMLPTFKHRRNDTAISIAPKVPDVPTGKGAEPHNIIILGNSYAGLACAHRFLDHCIDRLRITPGSPSYRLIIVGPSTHLYWNISAPRAMVAPGLIKHEDAFINIEEGFHRHRGQLFTHIQGTCTDLDPELRTIEIDLHDFEAQRKCSLLLPKSEGFDPKTPAFDIPRIQTLPFHAIILATGTRTPSDLFSLHGPHHETIASLTSIHAQIASAKSIVISGGGPTGVETAGQLATYLNHASHFPFRRKVKSPKTITLISGGSTLLPRMPAATSIKAEKLLRKLGVEITHNVQVLHTQPWFDQTGATKLSLSDRTSLITDLYIPCTGLKPNSDYIADGWDLKDDSGYILTNSTDLRCDMAGSRIYALGDVASNTQNNLMDVYTAVPVLMHNLLVDLLVFELEADRPDGGHEARIEMLRDEEFVQTPEGERMLSPISRWGGVGTWRGWKMPKVMVHLLKGKRYRLGKTGKVVVEGGNPYASRGKWE